MLPLEKKYIGTGYFRVKNNVCRLKKNSFLSIFADEVSFLKLTYYKYHNIINTLHTSCKLTHYLGAWTSNLAGSFPGIRKCYDKGQNQIGFTKTAREYPNTLAGLMVSSRDANFYKKYIQGMPSCKIQ